MSPSDPIAVVGLGCVFPGAPEVETLWDNVIAGRDAITEAPADRIDPRHFAPGAGSSDPLRARRGGFLDGDALAFEPARFGIMPVAVAAAEPDQMLALATASAALEDAAGLDGVDRERIGVVLGRGGYLTPGLARLDQRVRGTSQVLETLVRLLPEIEEDRLIEVRESLEAQLGDLNSEAAIGLVPNLAASRVANRFDLGGPAYTVDAACASSLLAIDAAVSELASRRCDAVLAGGVHHCHDVTLWSVFSRLGALSGSGEIRPYSRDADGLLIAEGTGIIALERLSDAIRLGHRVYATIAGVGVSSDGRHASLMSPGVEGQVLALERAYRAARVDPATIGLLEGHGTATPVGDRAELETIRRVYGAPDAGGAPRGVLGSVKSNIGHAMPAAGAAGLIKAVLSVHDGVLPPTLHAGDPHPAVAETRFRLLDQAEPWRSDRPGARRAGVSAFGFGGINAHVIVEQHGAGASRRGAGAAREADGFRFDAIVLEGRDAGDLLDQLGRVSLDAANDLALGRANPPGGGQLPPGGGGPARIAIVDPTPKRLELAARVLAKGHPWRGRNDIWFEPAGLLRDGGRVAFLFPGIEPSQRAELDDVASWFRLDSGEAPPEATGLERDGREMFEAGRLLHRALGALGVVPDEIAGHSLGEWTGAFAAELIPAVRSDDFLAGLEPGTLELPDVAFVALGCGAERARELLDGLAGVVVSHDNCPHQSVICGPAARIEEACRRFAAARVMASELPFRSGFHTPFFEPYLEVVRRQWDRMPLQAPRTPLWSATICDRYPADAAAVRRLAAEHLVRPVKFRETIERMYAAGTRVFVQLGVGSLVAFADDTLKGRPQLSIPAAAPDRRGLDQLARVGAALWVQGVDVRFERLLRPVAAPPAAARGVAAGAVMAGKHGPAVKLSLGTPLLALPDSVVAGASVVAGSAAAAAPAQIAAPALQAELDALLAETLGAHKSIAAALAKAPPARRRRERTPSPPAATPAPRAINSRETLNVDLDSFPWLADHCFYRQPAGWRELSDRFPVMPMTTIIELLRQAAARLVPELTVTRIEHVRASRWLTGAPPTRAVLALERTGEHEVHASIEGFARATIHMAAAAAPHPAPRLPPLTNPRPSPIDSDRLYSDHWMFHGQSFQGVREIDALGDDGVDGRIESLPTPGAWLDNAGQIYGLWLMATAESNFLALPQSIDSIEFFGIQPPPGEIVDTFVRITELGPRTMRADFELVWNGSVVVRIGGWLDRRFDSDAPLWQMLREPEHHLLASPTETGYLAVEERWIDSASRELMARRYLDAEERACYARLDPRRQRLWLLGRIAAKDAVRHALWSEGHGPLFPVEIPLLDDGERAAIVRGGPAAGRRVALAAAPWIGVAAVGPDRIYVEGFADGDGDAARLQLVSQLAADGAAGAKVHADVLRSPVHPLLAPPENSRPGQGYVVARTQPN
jgi:acyl transferase domain-containing protein